MYERMMPIGGQYKMKSSDGRSVAVGADGDRIVKIRKPHFAVGDQVERSASMGFILAARRAGRIPKTTPTTNEKPQAARAVVTLKLKV